MRNSKFCIFFAVLLFPVAAFAQWPLWPPTASGAISTYGAMGFADSSVTIAMTQNNYVQVTNATNTLFTQSIAQNVTVAGDSILVNSSGYYWLFYSLSYSGANTDNYHTAFYYGGMELAGLGETDRGMSGTDPGVIAGGIITYLSAGAGVSVRVKNTANNNDATLTAGSISVVKL